MIFKEITYPSIIKGLYNISEYGDIYNTKTKKILKPFISSKHNKYFIIKLKCIYNNSEHYKNFRINRLVAWEFCNGRDIAKVVMHIDNNKRNNYYKNLKWGTIGENTRSAYTDGIIPRNRLIYNIELIEFICKKMEDGLSNNQILKILCGDDATMRKYKSTWYLIYHLRCKDRYTSIAMKYNYDALININNTEKNIIKLMIDGLENIDIMHKYGYNSIKSNSKLYYMILRCRKIMKICSTTREKDHLMTLLND
nr:MAG TPA: homing endonuclease [Caudoviricetes sp.]